MFILLKLACQKWYVFLSALLKQLRLVKNHLNALLYQRSVALDTSTIDDKQTIFFFDQVEPCGEQQMVDEMVTGFRIQYNTNVSWQQRDRSATRILTSSLEKLLAMTD